MLEVLAKDIIRDFSLEALRERFRVLWGALPINCGRGSQ